MGMGDKEIPYAPKYEPVWCDVTAHNYSPVSVRECPVPSVIRKYGVGGKCKVSVYICRKCRYGRRVEMFDGWRCGYELE